MRGSTGLMGIGVQGLGHSEALNKEKIGRRQAKPPHITRPQSRRAELHRPRRIEVHMRRLASTIFLSSSSTLLTLLFSRHLIPLLAI